jgi:hypothetical protein
MAKPVQVLIAQSLARVEVVSNQGIARSEDLKRIDRERLLKGGWLHPIISGWYFLLSPQAQPSESLAWYFNYWAFIQHYLANRFDNDYCLSAECSLNLHVANNTIPQQLVVISKKGGSDVLALPHHTSLMYYQDKQKFPHETSTLSGLKVMPLPLALSRVSKSYFERQPINAEMALLMVRDPSELNHQLLTLRSPTAAGRLAGAYQKMGKSHFAEQIMSTMAAAGYKVEPQNPFGKKPVVVGKLRRVTSPISSRITAMWQTLREDIIAVFPERRPSDAKFETIINRLENIHLQDAYHSLSIEGYEVSKELIVNIHKGSWQRAENASQQKAAMAAKGYFACFQQVLSSIRKIFKGEDASMVIQSDLPKWNRALFSPSVEAGIINESYLAGYRNGQVYIRNSVHIPPPKEALLDCLDTFFECLAQERNPIARAVLGHFIFEYIHPYMEGNGRTGRLIMNVLWIAAGYPWTIVRLESRQRYLQSIERASVEVDIVDFAKLLAQEMGVEGVYCS